MSEWQDISHHKQQMHRPSRAGDNARGARSVYAPAANDDAQDWRSNPAGFFMVSDLLQLGRGLRGSGPFTVSRNPTVGVSSPLTRAGRQAVERIPYRRSGLPFLRFKTTDHVACNDESTGGQAR